VVAFEAFPYYARALRMLNRLAGWKNVTIIGRAAYSHRTRLALAWADQRGKRLAGFTHIQREGEPTVERLITVRAIPIDDLRLWSGETPVSVIKIDVEGAEYDVLHGAAQTIGRWRPAIYLETNGRNQERMGRSVEDLMLLMSGYGYEAHVVEPSLDTSVVIRRAMEADVERYNDLLFLTQSRISE
jgi:FkbM family methyltransferase